MNKCIKTSANNEINTHINGNTDSNLVEHFAPNFHSMSFNPYQSSSTNTTEFGNHSIKKMMTNPIRSHNIDHIHRRPTAIGHRNLNSIGTGYAPRSIRYPDSDDTRSSSIDYNFNYVKFRSPLSAASKATQYRDSSTTSTLATDCSLFARSSPKYNDDDKKQSFVMPKVHNHPNCQCSIHNCCPFASRFEQTNPTHHGVYERKYFASRFPYRRRDLNYEHKIHDSPPEYDQIDDFLMKRTFSHDRLFSQRRVTTVRNRTRPKSYCSNVNHCPTQL